jgi:hypothetical protein
VPSVCHSLVADDRPVAGESTMSSTAVTLQHELVVDRGPEPRE